MCKRIMAVRLLPSLWVQFVSLVFSFPQGLAHAKQANSHSESKRATWVSIRFVGNLRRWHSTSKQLSAWLEEDDGYLLGRLQGEAGASYWFWRPEKTAKLPILQANNEMVGRWTWSAEMSDHVNFGHLRVWLKSYFTNVWLSNGCVKLPIGACIVKRIDLCFWKRLKGTLRYCRDRVFGFIWCN